jgi:hypothetical protein
MQNFGRETSLKSSTWMSEGKVYYEVGGGVHETGSRSCSITDFVISGNRPWDISCFLNKHTNWCIKYIWVISRPNCLAFLLPLTGNAIFVASVTIT